MFAEMFLIGACCYGFAVGLDKYMYYGHALGFIRFWIGWTLANDEHRTQLDVVRANETDFGERINIIDGIYMEIVMYRPYFLFFICKTCMTFWVVVAASLICQFGWLQGFLILGSAYIASMFDK